VEPEKPDLEDLKRQIEEQLRAEYEEKLRLQQKNLQGGPQQLTDGRRKLEARKKALRLKRVIVTCRDPMKQSWEGEIISAGNDVIGDVKKYIPFDVDEGWHVPEIILNVLKTKKCTVFVNKKGRDGTNVKVPKQINAYSVTELPPLTEEELKELARAQRARNLGEEA
jgi:hypothetical protein